MGPGPCPYIYKPDPSSPINITLWHPSLPSSGHYLWSQTISWYKLNQKGKVAWNTYLPMRVLTSFVSTHRTHRHIPLLTWMELSGLTSGCHTILICMWRGQPKYRKRGCKVLETKNNFSTYCIGNIFVRWRSNIISCWTTLGTASSTCNICSMQLIFDHRIL